MTKNESPAFSEAVREIVNLHAEMTNAVSVGQLRHARVLARAVLCTSLHLRWQPFAVAQEAPADGFESFLDEAEKSALAVLEEA